MEEYEMAEDVASEIQNALTESWHQFINCYNELTPEYSKTLSEGDNKETSHWICWNEYDLMFHLGKLFYHILCHKKEKIDDIKNIQIHFEKNINKSNFEGYTFENRLDELKEKLNMKKGPKVDMIVTNELSSDSFLLCAEVKFFHGPTWYESPVQQINRDIQKLKVLKECEIAQKVLFILLDDYYYYTDNRTSVEIMNEIKKHEKDVTILFGDTSSKLK
jgi:hypothetical protein